jgi:hypothetical protein
MGKVRLSKAATKSFRYKSGEMLLCSPTRPQAQSRSSSPTWLTCQDFLLTLLAYLAVDLLAYTLTQAEIVCTNADGITS